MISNKRNSSLIGCSLLAYIIAAPAYAQTWNFEISRQPAATAITALGEQADVQIIAARRITAGKQANAIRGNMNVDQAIKLLLLGTDLAARQTGPKTYTIVPKMPTSTAARVTRLAAVGELPRSLSATVPAAPPPQPSAAPDGAMPDIVVTAQRRSESLQTVPISISVATGETLRKENIYSLEDLGQRSAGVKIAQGGASDQLHIRGTGSGFNPGFEQSVATFVDGVYRSRSRSIRLAFFDVNRIEVLKGPQTTFFGANAIAGAINITTKAPGNSFEGNASALYSPSDGEYNLEAGVSMPISKDLAVRVAGRFSGMNGYIHLDRQNTDGPKLDNKQGRVSVRWTPTDRLAINARYDVARLRDKGVLATELVGCPPSGGPPLGQCARNLAVLGPIDDDLNYHSASAAPTRSDVNFDEATVTAKLDLDAVTLVSTSGYLKQKADILNDVAPYPAISPIGSSTYFLSRNFERFEQFSQEIRLQSNSDGPLSYMVGGYYEHGKLLGDAKLGFYLAPFGAAAAPVYSATTPVALNLVTNQVTDTWSGFGSVSYKLTDALTLTTGLRYSNVRKRADRALEMGTADAFVSAASFVPAPLAVQPILAAATGNSRAAFPIPSRSDDKFMPSANIRYEFNPDVMVYASYARGFKAGGFSQTTPDTFAPELVDSNEFGIKARWFGRRLTTNLTFFRSDYSDLQETANVFTPAGAITSIVTNAARSRSSGVEFSGSLRMGDLTLRSDLAYLDANYVNYPSAPCTPLETATGANCPRDLSGSRRAFAPEWSGSAGADYRISIDDKNSLRLGSTVSFTSAYYLQPIISKLVEQAGYAKIDLRAAIGPDDRRWELALIGKNVTNKVTTSFGNYLPGAPSSTIAVADRPRSIAIQASIIW